MSARAWAARVGVTEARNAREEALACRTPGCLLNRRPHVVHFIPSPTPAFAYGTNRRGRRAARRRGLVKP